MTEWKLVSKRQRKLKCVNSPGGQSPEGSECESYNGSEKINAPCWFYNNGGCRHKDGREKSASDCKYLHEFSTDVQRPPHLGNRKPCDKYNLEHYCKWGSNCKYSHRYLSPDEWGYFYPDYKFTLEEQQQQSSNVSNTTPQTNVALEDLIARMKIFEYKQECMSKEIKYLLSLYFRKAPLRILSPNTTTF